jgi:Cu/Ag efflux pump CusA
MAVVTIGGVLAATSVTLFLIPVIDTKLDRFAAPALRVKREARKEQE